MAWLGVRVREKNWFYNIHLIHTHSGYMLSQTFKQLEIFFLSLSTSFAPQQPQYIFFFNLLKHKKF